MWQIPSVGVVWIFSGTTNRKSHLFQQKLEGGCMRPTVTHRNWTNCEACKKLLGILPIRNTHIYPCNSTGYQNKLFCAYSQTGYANGLHNTWAVCNVG